MYGVYSRGGYNTVYLPQAVAGRPGEFENSRRTICCKMSITAYIWTSPAITIERGETQAWAYLMTRRHIPTTRHLESAQCRYRRAAATSRLDFAAMRRHCFWLTATDFR